MSGSKLRRLSTPVKLHSNANVRSVTLMAATRLDTVKTTCRISHWASARGRKVMLGCWWQLSSELFSNCWPSGIFPHSHIWGLHRMGWKRENIQWAEVLWVKMLCECQRSALLYNQGVHKSISECTSSFKAAEDHSGRHCCQIRRGSS